MQPRVTPTLPQGEERSVFQRLFTGAGGVDAYAGAASDVYQDLFGEGSFTGKGLYDVDAFDRALAGRVPPNRLLSHDLFEGIFARCALVSDVEVFEDFPSHVEVAAARQHRWARGDWQLLPWIFGSRGRDIPAIGRWKMLDNLRRTLSAPAALILLVLSWALPRAPQGLWLALVVAALAVPAVIALLDTLVALLRAERWFLSLRSFGEKVLLATGQVLFALTLLAHHAWLMTDAIIRTLVRLYHYPSQVAGMDDGGAGEGALRLCFDPFPLAVAQRHRCRDRRQCGGALFQPGVVTCRRAFACIVVGRAVICSSDELTAAIGYHTAVVLFRCTVAAQHGAPHMAFFHDICDARRQSFTAG